MKTRIFVSILILVLAVLIITGGCATERKLNKSIQEEIVGTWINTEYNDFNGKFAKQIIQPDLARSIVASFYLSEIDVICLLSMEMFDTLFEVRAPVERWRREYNHIRPHSALGYRPPALEVIIPMGA